MTDLPILFSGPMIQALIDGTKTQTRRVVKITDDLADQAHTGDLVNYYGDRRLGMRFEGTTLVQPIRYTPGDRLWVRETWQEFFTDELPKDRPTPIKGRMGIPARPDRQSAIAFRADGEMPNHAEYGKAIWRPSTFMPRWASRLTLTVTAVRVQRLQDISEDDAIAEGIYRTDPTPADIESGCTPQDFVFQAPGVRQGWGQTKEERQRDQWWPNAKGAFRLLWDSLNAKRGFGWEVNPWVCALSFDIHRCNIDEMETSQ